MNLILESCSWLVAVPAINRPSFSRLKGHLASLAAFRACRVVHFPVAAFKSHSFTFFRRQAPKPGCIR